MTKVRACGSLPRPPEGQPAAAASEEPGWQARGSALPQQPHFPLRHLCLARIGEPPIGGVTCPPTTQVRILPPLPAVPHFQTPTPGPSSTLRKPVPTWVCSSRGHLLGSLPGGKSRPTGRFSTALGALPGPACLPAQVGKSQPVTREPPPLTLGPTGPALYAHTSHPPTLPPRAQCLQTVNLEIAPNEVSRRRSPAALRVSPLLHPYLGLRYTELQAEPRCKGHLGFSLG